MSKDQTSFIIFVGMLLLSHGAFAAEAASPSNELVGSVDPTTYDRDMYYFGYRLQPTRFVEPSSADELSPKDPLFVHLRLLVNAFKERDFVQLQALLSKNELLISACDADGKCLIELALQDKDLYAAAQLYKMGFVISEESLREALVAMHLETNDFVLAFFNTKPGLITDHMMTLTKILTEELRAENS